MLLGQDSRGHQDCHLLAFKHRLATLVTQTRADQQLGPPREPGGEVELSALMLDAEEGDPRTFEFLTREEPVYDTEGFWYPYDTSPEFPEMEAGTRTAMAGPVYRAVRSGHGHGFPDREVEAIVAAVLGG